MSEIAVRIGDADAAFRAAGEAHAGNEAFIPQMRADMLRILDAGRNPLVKGGHGRFEVITAHRDGKPVGRVVASIHDASNRVHAESQGRFGYLDYVDDADVARALLGRAEDWARERGMTEIAGNFSLTAMQQVGVVTSRFDGIPYTDMTWTPPHVAAHLAELGYEPYFPMTTFETDLSGLDPETLIGKDRRALLSEEGYEAVTVTRRELPRALREANEVLNDGFSDNPMFVPPTWEEFEFQAGEMSWIMDPRLSQVVRHRGKAVGVVICIPDLGPLMRATKGVLGLSAPYHFLRHRLRRRRAVIVYYSVSKTHHGKGIAGWMLGRVTKALKDAGYTHLGITWIADVNGASLRQMERLKARPLNGLHLFRKALR